jgi:TRAP-type C4-dicarboxylate transport system permease small subunit
MISSTNNFLKSIYKFSGYIAAVFLILVAIFILTGISSRIFGFYIRGLAEYSGYSMAASSFFALAYTFHEKAHIRITLFLEKFENKKKKIFRNMVFVNRKFFFRVYVILFYQNGNHINKI